MSATNWSKCPICKKETLKIEDKYGKVSLEEFKELLEQDEHEYGENTVREDYEVYHDKEGNWFFTGSASCNKCRAEWEGELIMKIQEEGDGQ